jgi:hypothetical protein
MAGQVTAPRIVDRRVATNPECKGAQIFQKNHTQIAELGRRGLFARAELYFLLKIRLNLPALESSQTALQANAG